jgi:hypothetical protein
LRVLQAGTFQNDVERAREAFLFSDNYWLLIYIVLHDWGNVLNICKRNKISLTRAWVDRIEIYVLQGLADSDVEPADKGLEERLHVDAGKHITLNSDGKFLSSMLCNEVPYTLSRRGHIVISVEDLQKVVKDALFDVL